MAPKPRLTPELRAARREARKQRKHENSVALTNGLVEISKQGISSIGHFGAEVARAHGVALRGWLGNSDGLAWAGSAVAVSAYITWLSIMLGSVGDKLGLPILNKLMPTTLAAQALADIGDRLSPNPKFENCYVTLTGETACWFTPQLRDLRQTIVLGEPFQNDNHRPNHKVFNTKAESDTFIGNLFGAGYEQADVSFGLTGQHRWVVSYDAPNPPPSVEVGGGHITTRSTGPQ